MPSDNCLLITNGGATTGGLKINKAARAYLTWDDILHEGPVPQCDSLGELSKIRGEFLEHRYGEPSRDEPRTFAKRDATIENHEAFERIELWFEHDLYDQLQLIQVLDYFAGQANATAKIHLVQADDYLGMQPPDKIMRFRDLSAPVTGAQFAAAQQAWAAFRQPTPEAWTGLLDADLIALPWLRPAVRRMLEELPGYQTGLSRMEQEFLALVGDGWTRAARCVGQFLSDQFDGPDPAFIGDATLFNLLREFSGARHPLIEPLKGNWQSADETERMSFRTSPLRITEYGRDLLAGDVDQITVNGIDRWWGGTHLTTDNCWRWDPAAQKLIAP